MKSMLTAEKLYSILNKHYPQAKIGLTSNNPLQTLIAVILSAQCTDKRVNIVTKELFKHYRKAEDYAYGELDELKKYIRSTGFFNAKAKNIQNTCKIIVEKHNGNVPETMEKLIELPGVGRKTANIVLTSAYGIISGIPVDTHMIRINYRLGLTKHKDPVKIEQDLMKQLPKELWNKYSHAIIEHGRALCKAPVPICSECFLIDECPRVDVVKSK